MNLLTYATLRNGVVNGKKLTKPQLNLLGKLDAMGVELTSAQDVLVTNPHNGYSAMLPPFVATLVNWVYEVYSSYNYGPMTCRGTKVAIQTFDRTRYLILALDSKVFSDFID
jgi:hypothetical protein